jgi:hypothetical protein
LHPSCDWLAPTETIQYGLAVAAGTFIYIQKRAASTTQAGRFFGGAIAFVAKALTRSAERFP